MIKDICLECGATVAPGSTYCPGCHKKLKPIPVCENCRYAASEGDKYCPLCGAPKGIAVYIPDVIPCLYGSPAPQEEGERSPFAG